MLKEKEKGAFVSESALHVSMAISRILCGQFLGRDDHLSLPDFSKSPIPRSRDRDATTPEDKSGRLPFLCFVLHRMGFFVPRELLCER